MEEHLESLRKEVNQKQVLLNEREVSRSLSWSVWSLEERDLCSSTIQETREELFELKRQLNTTLIAYNEIKRVDQSLPFGQRRFSNDKILALQNKLQIPLSREDVSTRQGGGRQEVVYLETHKAIEKAREIFGLEDFSIEIRGEPSVLFQTSGKLCMKAIIRVTLSNGCFQEDVGVSSSNLSDPVEAVKLACKSCISDGIKRALCHFGPALGSSLKDKDYVQSDLMTATTTSFNRPCPLSSVNSNNIGKHSKKMKEQPPPERLKEPPPVFSSKTREENDLNEWELAVMMEEAQMNM